MLSLSKTQATTIRVAFTTSNLSPAGFTAQLKINGQTYTIAPVANGSVATASISTVQASAINTDFFIADLMVYDSTGSVFQTLRETGAVHNRELSETEKSGNIIPVLLMPSFPMPDGHLTLELPITFTKESGGTTQKYGVDIVDDDAGIDLAITRK